MVQRGLKCDMDKPAWGLSGTTDTYMVFAGGGRSQMQARFEGVFLYGRKKAKAEKTRLKGAAGLPESLQQRHWADCRLVGGQRHCSVAHTDCDWGQVGAAIVDAGDAGEAGAGQGRQVGPGSAGLRDGDSKPQEE